MERMKVTKMSIRTYSELIQIPTFIDRYRYLRLGGRIGVETFGMDRWINQNFYQKDEEWLAVRDFVIIRDNGCDLAMPDRQILSHIMVHHMNPITKDDIIRRTKWLLDPEYLICTIDNTHKAIHYGDESKLILAPVERRPNDTCPWKRC